MWTQKVESSLYIIIDKNIKKYKFNFQILKLTSREIYFLK